jgi:hypothetical protein
MEEENENLEMAPPYQRLQAILSEGKSSKDLNLLGKEELTTWGKIKEFFAKIDSKIFSKSKMTNRFQKR